MFDLLPTSQNMPLQKITPGHNHLRSELYKMFQHENYGISEICEYFCTKFCSFVYETTVQECAALCCIYLAYAKLMETRTSGSPCSVFTGHFYI